MRFYNLEITNPKTGASVIPSSLEPTKITSLNADGSFNPAALNIEIDITQSPYHLPTGESWVRIWGLSLKDLSNSFDLNGFNISVFGGMSKGLPLANPAQSGLLVKGSIFQAFGNWVGTDQTLDLICGPPTGSIEKPFNFVLNWQAGTTLASALTNTLNTAFPNAKKKIALSNRLALNHDESGYWATLAQMNGWLNQRTKAIITDPGYPGANISYDGTTVSAYDFSGPPNPVKAIAFQDLIGQPTWIGPLLIRAQVVMRADLDLGDLVSLPAGLVTTTAQTLSRYQDKTTFSGNYQISDIHHYGNFRQPDAASWNTTLTMFPQSK